MKHLIRIILTIAVMPDKVELFDTPVIVKKDGVSILECWGVGLNQGLWLMDEKGGWYEWEPADQNAQEVIEALYERMKVETIAA
jgi:hypothetical protein